MTSKTVYSVELESCMTYPGSYRSKQHLLLGGSFMYLASPSPAALRFYASIKDGGVSVRRPAYGWAILDLAPV